MLLLLRPLRERRALQPTLLRGGVGHPNVDATEALWEQQRVPHRLHRGQLARPQRQQPERAEEAEQLRVGRAHAAAAPHLRLLAADLHLPRHRRPKRVKPLRRGFRLREPQLLREKLKRQLLQLECAAKRLRAAEQLLDFALLQAERVREAVTQVRQQELLLLRGDEVAWGAKPLQPTCRKRQQIEARQPPAEGLRSRAQKPSSSRTKEGASSPPHAGCASRRSRFFASVSFRARYSRSSLGVNGLSPAGASAKSSSLSAGGSSNVVKCCLTNSRRRPVTSPGQTTPSSSLRIVLRAAGSISRSRDTEWKSGCEARLE
eukprot:4714997-Pleurochrysis_carterae.AAC.3